MASTFLSGRSVVVGSTIAVKALPSNRKLRQRVSAAVQEPPVSKKELRKPRNENVDAEKGFFVDHTCIDCDTCRWMAPEFYKRKNQQSAVVRQPETEDERIEAFRALLSCPTYSIHGPSDAKAEQRAAEESFPRLIQGTENCYHCGFHDELSFGCASYLIKRPEGNILVDVPRYVPKLVNRIKELGGAKYIFLTHRDDVAAHYKWASALGAERIMHQAETNEKQKTDEVEHKLEGEGPWSLPDGSEDCQIIFTPGHTEAHCVLLYKPQKVLFSGDHLAADSVAEWNARFEPNDDGFLGISRNFNWWRVDKQVESCTKLADYDWLMLLPGHGRPGAVKDAAQRKEQLALISDRESKRSLGHLPTDHSMQRLEFDY
ncbi:g11121 [Coccomyxa viridis]|uniref:G11121 protein n=1 Tax=Coccomyxa viridis TaxID=1274662 RepID=A0ABP1GBB6_9CHLO